MEKPERINFRLDAEARRKLKAVCEITGLDEPTALRACIQAFVEHVEKNGGIWLPLAIVPKSELPKPTKDFPEVGALPNAAADDLSSPSIERVPPHGLNEDSPPRVTLKPAGPRPRSTRGIRGLTSRKEES